MLKSLKYMVRDSHALRHFLLETGVIDACFSIVTRYIKSIGPDEAFQLKFMIGGFLGFLGTLVNNLSKVSVAA